MVIRTRAVLPENEYERKMRIAALLSKNNKGEQDAIEGYHALLSVIGDSDAEAVSIINEIISDEKNHSEKLNALTEKYDSIEPNKD